MALYGDRKLRCSDRGVPRPPRGKQGQLRTDSQQPSSLPSMRSSATSPSMSPPSPCTASGSLPSPPSVMNSHRSATSQRRRRPYWWLPQVPRPGSEEETGRSSYSRRRRACAIQNSPHSLAPISYLVLPLVPTSVASERGERGVAPPCAPTLSPRSRHGCLTILGNRLPRCSRTSAAGVSAPTPYSASYHATLPLPPRRARRFGQSHCPLTPCDIPPPWICCAGEWTRP